MNSLRQIAAKASEKPLTLFSYFRTFVACLPSYLFTLIPPLLWRCNYENKQRSFTENSRRTVTRFQLSVAQPVKVHDAIGQSVYYNYKCLSVEQKSQHLAGCLGNVNNLRVLQVTIFSTSRDKFQLQARKSSPRFNTLEVWRQHVVQWPLLP